MTQKRTLDRSAYEPLPEGQSYQPYISSKESLPEFTAKAVIPGILFGILFGAANAYLGLQAGLTISTSIPVAVMSVAAFRVFRMFGVQGSILEANLAQTVGSASSSVASGIIFTLPALFLWGMPPGLLQMTLLAMCGGLMGVLFMVPLRRFLIDREHGRLPYPEGTACAEVLVATEAGGDHARNVFVGIGIGAALKGLISWLHLVPSTVKIPIALLPRAQVGMKLSAALFGVGYILGPRIGAIMVGGGLLSSLVIIPIIAAWGSGRSVPLYPAIDIIDNLSASEIWTNYVRYIGAGAVATAGLITLIKSIPMMIESFKVAAGQLRSRLESADIRISIPRTERDLSLKTVGIGLGILALVMALIPQVFGVIQSGAIRAAAAILIIIFGFFFVTVASRIVGLVGVTSNPTSGMTIASLLGTATIFLMMGWTDDVGKAAALCVGCVVAIAASIAGDTSQDLKTGFLLGATPRKQQAGELIGVLTCAVFVCWTVQWMSPQFGTDDLPAPQATLMKVVIDGVLQQSLPWTLIGIGAAIAVIVELFRLPSLPFAVGVYLPVSTMVPVFLGGLLRHFVEKRAPSDVVAGDRRERGVLFGSGLVGGEGLIGVAIAAHAAKRIIEATSSGTALPKRGPDLVHQWAVQAGLSSEWASICASSVALGLFALFVVVFARTCKERSQARHG